MFYGDTFLDFTFQSMKWSSSHDVKHKTFSICWTSLNINYNLWLRRTICVNSWYAFYTREVYWLRRKMFDSSTYVLLPKKLQTLDSGLDLNMGPRHGLRLSEGTACITVRRNPTQLVKHTDCLRVTSGLWPSLPASSLGVTLDRISPFLSFLLCPLWIFTFPFSRFI